MSVRDLLLLAKSRMNVKKRTTAFLGGKWITLRNDPESNTGCNVFFTEDNVIVRMADNKVFFINDPNERKIADAIVTIFLWPDQAERML
jgi:hypothetical protein